MLHGTGDVIKGSSFNYISSPESTHFGDDGRVSSEGKNIGHQFRWELLHLVER